MCHRGAHKLQYTEDNECTRVPGGLHVTASHILTTCCFLQPLLRSALMTDVKVPCTVHVFFSAAVHSVLNGQQWSLDYGHHHQIHCCTVWAYLLFGNAESRLLSRNCVLVFLSASENQLCVLFFCYIFH